MLATFAEDRFLGSCEVAVLLPFQFGDEPHPPRIITGRRAAPPRPFCGELTGPCLSPADRANLEALQAFTQARTATRAIGFAIEHYPDTCRALESAEADQDQARRALQQILDALDKVNNAQSSFNQIIEDLWQRASSE